MTNELKEELYKVANKDAWYTTLIGVPELAFIIAVPSLVILGLCCNDTQLLGAALVSAILGYVWDKFGNYIYKKYGTLEYASDTADELGVFQIYKVNKENYYMLHLHDDSDFGYYHYIDPEYYSRGVVDIQEAHIYATKKTIWVFFYQVGRTRLQLDEQDWDGLRELTKERARHGMSTYLILSEEEHAELVRQRKENGQNEQMLRVTSYQV